MDFLTQFSPIDPVEIELYYEESKELFSSEVQFLALYSDVIRQVRAIKLHQCSADTYWSKHMEKASFTAACLGGEQLQNKCIHLTMPECSKTPLNR